MQTPSDSRESYRRFPGHLERESQLSPVGRLAIVLLLAVPALAARSDSSPARLRTPPGSR